MAKKKETKPAAQAPEETKPAAPAAEEVQPEATKPESDKSAKEITVKVPGGSEFTGVVVSKRKTNSGAQVFLKIKGGVSRWINAEDIVK